MQSTTNFDSWLDEINISDPADVYALHTAIDGETWFASFEAKRAPNGKLIVTAPGESTALVLVSDHAKESFLNLLCAQYVEGGMGIGAWYAMHQGLSSDD
ncbi:hypothetical protein [Comamonas sp. GB3 AK4-5]|uniref:hypothetical protein n=1 Tax=Comamonas sp. GB3 AK4-5 TaxID=3231487 RepID=UPI00351ECC5B